MPAVLAYNYFLRRLKTTAGDFEEFANQLVGSALKSRFLAVERSRDEGRSSERTLGLQQEASA